MLDYQLGHADDDDGDQFKGSRYQVRHGRIAPRRRSPVYGDSKPYIG
jgi:hypothetical protein